MGKHHDDGTAPLQKGAGDRFNSKVSAVVINGAIKREEDIRRNFVRQWGEILEGRTGPATLEGVIEAKQQAVGQLHAQLSGRPASDVQQDTTYGQLERTATLSARGQGPEGGLAAAFKIMKAGT